MSNKNKLIGLSLIALGHSALAPKTIIPTARATDS